jgi:protein-S-isoprenylcysteine O-methyltransferase Ste14
MQALLNFLNGKKTAIGAAILSVFSVLALFGVKVPAVDEASVTHYIEVTIQVVGIVAAVVGIIHKLIKGK